MSRQLSAGHLSEDELVSLPIREFNDAVKLLPKDQVEQLRKQRRTLKNRGYAQKARKNQGLTKEAELERQARLKAEIAQLEAEIGSLREAYASLAEKNAVLSKAKPDRSNVSLAFAPENMTPKQCLDLLRKGIASSADT